MKTEKTFRIISSIFLVMIVNTMVNFSDNLYMGINHPYIYFSLVIPGLVLGIYIQLTGAYIILDKINRRINGRTNHNN